MSEKEPGRNVGFLWCCMNDIIGSLDLDSVFATVTVEG